MQPFVCYCLLNGDNLFDFVATRERRLVLRLALAIAMQQVCAVQLFAVLRLLLSFICVTMPRHGGGFAAMAGLPAG